jgi:hypothetical protein
MTRIGGQLTVKADTAAAVSTSASGSANQASSVKVEAHEPHETLGVTETFRATDRMDVFTGAASSRAWPSAPFMTTSNHTPLDRHLARRFH